MRQSWPQQLDFRCKNGRRLPDAALALAAPLLVEQFYPVFEDAT
ncbi:MULTISPECIES: hypothetical protein [unclassified Streptomyces]